MAAKDIYVDQGVTEFQTNNNYQNIKDFINEAKKL